jgi:hypothetical protein
MLERGRADDQHPFGGKVAGEDFHRRDRLHRLAEAHLVADQGAAGARGEQRAFALVGIELDLEQALQFGAVGAQRIGGGERLPAYLAVADFGDEGQRVLSAAQVVAGGANAVDERRQIGKVLRGSCQPLAGRTERRHAACSSAGKSLPRRRRTRRWPA